MPDVGDTATATLTVTPFDETTDAALHVTAPDATTSDPTPATADSGATWTATVTYDQAGWWLLTWTVTGTGAGVEHQKVLVTATPGIPPYLPVYTTLELVKESLNEPTGRDALLQEKIVSASRSIDVHTGRRFYLDATVTARILNPRRRVVADREGQRLLVDDIGTTVGLIVEVGSTANGWTAVTTSVEAEPTDALVKLEPVTSLLHLSGSFLSGPRVRVTAKWGWPAIPQVIREATLIQALRLYKRKDSPEGVLGSAEWGTVRVSRLDPDVAKLVESLVLPGFG
jgi:hypothetical protein